MDVPTWAYDDYLASTENPSTLKLALALYRHGSPQVSAEGNRRCYWRGTKSRLASLARISKRSLDAAIIELVEAGIVVEHEVSDTRQGIAISALTVREERTVRGATVAPGHLDHRATVAPPSESKSAVWGATVAPPSEAKTGIHACMHRYIDHDHDHVSTTMHAERGATVAPLDAPAADETVTTVAALTSVGVTDAGRWLERWRPTDIDAALDRAMNSPGVANPGGFARALLNRGFRADEHPAKRADRWMVAAHAAVESGRPAPPYDIALILNSAAWQRDPGSVNATSRARAAEWLAQNPGWRDSS